MTRFTSFVPSTTHFIWLSSFIFKMICASSNMIEYAVWTSGVAKAPGTVSILPWSVFDVRKIQKREDWSCVEVFRIHEEEKDPRLKHETTKLRSKGCETRRKHTYYCDVSRWPRFGTDRQPLLISFLDFSLGTCTGYPRTYRTANDLIRKRLLRRRNYCLLRSPK